MKISNTSTRLKKIMTDNNMRQVDILKKVEPYCQVYNIKMNKSDISQYVSGKAAPPLHQIDKRLFFKDFPPGYRTAGFAFCLPQPPAQQAPAMIFANPLH